MRFLSSFFRTFGIISFTFIVFSVVVVYGVTNPRVSELAGTYKTIVILSGNPDRVILASRLYYDKNAKFIFLSKEPRLIKNYNRKGARQFVYQYYAQLLVKRGIEKDKIILFGPSKNTEDEFKALSTMLKNSSERVLVVTNKYHISRSIKNAEKFGIDHIIDFYPGLDSSAEDNNKNTLSKYILEYFKTLNFYLKYVGINIFEYR